MESVESQLADHAARLKVLEAQHANLADKLDTLRNLILVVLGGVVAQLLTLLLKR